MTPDTITLADAISLVQTKLAALPVWQSTRVWEEGKEYTSAYHNAVDTLIEELIATCGARVTMGEPVRVAMLGVTSTSTSGLEQALRNWIAAATRRRLAVVR